VLSDPLVPTRMRTRAMVVAVIAALVVAVLAVLLHGKRQTGVDETITRWLYIHLRSWWIARKLLTLSEPAFEVGVLGALAVGAAMRRAWNVVAVAVIGPIAAVVLSEFVLKPLVHRQLGGVSFPISDAYPSGHETGIAALLTVLGLLTLRTAWSAAAKTAILVAFGIWAVVAAIGLIRNFAHYPSDTVGGVGVALAVVIGTAFAIDAVTSRRLSAPDVPDRPRTARAA
jgi:undecaprenyl-diphosphatase